MAKHQPARVENRFTATGKPAPSDVRRTTSVARPPTQTVTPTRWAPRLSTAISWSVEPAACPDRASGRMRQKAEDGEPADRVQAPGHGRTGGDDEGEQEAGHERATEVEGLHEVAELGAEARPCPAGRRRNRHRSAPARRRPPRPTRSPRSRRSAARPGGTAPAARPRPGPASRWSARPPGRAPSAPPAVPSARRRPGRAAQRAAPGHRGRSAGRPGHRRRRRRSPVRARRTPCGGSSPGGCSPDQRKELRAGPRR